MLVYPKNALDDGLLHRRALDIGVRFPFSVWSPPRWPDSRVIVVGCRADLRRVRCLTIVEGAAEWCGGVATDAEGVRQIV